MLRHQLLVLRKILLSDDNEASVAVSFWDSLQAVAGKFGRKGRERCGECYLRGLLRDEERKSIEPMANHLGAIEGVKRRLRASAPAVRQPEHLGLAAGTKRHCAIQR